MKNFEISSTIEDKSSKIPVSDLQETEKDRMYNFSGQDCDKEEYKISERSRKRYLKSNKADKEILDIAKNKIYDSKEEILDSKDDERFLLIEKGLVAEDFEIKKRYAGLIRYAPINKRFFLINIVIEMGDIVLLKECAELIDFIPKYDERDILQGKMYSLIEKVLDTGDVENQKLCVELFGFVQRHKRFSLVEKGLSVNNVEVQREYSSLVNFYLLENFEIIPLKNKIDSLIEEGFKTGNIEIQKEYVEMIRNASEVKIFYFIDQFFKINNIEIQKACAKMVSRISKEEERVILQEKVFSLVEKSFVFGDAKMQKEYVEIINCAPGTKIFSLIKKGLETDNIEIQKICIRMISSVPEENERGDLLKIAKNKLGSTLVDTPLYSNNISSKNFSRNKQEKTGSETTLIGGKLKDKAIIRHIKPNAFLAWKRLYDDFDLWKDNGFDYVPIEPILSYKLNKKGLVDVHSGVLDLSLATWEEMSGDFLKELRKDRDKILVILENDVFNHGHPHNKNFCLRFFRDDKGNVDFIKKPRIYLIDFDQAVSFKNIIV